MLRAAPGGARARNGRSSLPREGDRLGARFRKGWLGPEVAEGTGRGRRGAAAGCGRLCRGCFLPREAEEGVIWVGRRI